MDTIIPARTVRNIPTCGPAAWSCRLNADFEDHVEHEYMELVTEHPEWEDVAWTSRFVDDPGELTSWPTCSARSATTNGCTSRRASGTWRTHGFVDPLE